MAASPQPEPPNKKTKTTTTAAATPRRTHQQLSDDVLLIEVLTWLPAKSLCRFKSVSRLWHATISGDPMFKLNQARRQTRISSGVIYCSTKLGGLIFPLALAQSIGVPGPRFGALNGWSFRLLASVHGLLLLIFGGSSYRNLYVCNPATQMGMRIPSAYHVSFFAVGLAFDPSVSPDSYKVIHVRPIYGDDDAKYKFEVFSSSTGEWTASLAKMLQLERGISPERVVFAGGVVYWHFPRTSILSYDTGADEAQLMALPPRTSKQWEDEIGVWGERLTYARVGDEGVEVWVMGKKQGKWEMKHRVDMEAVIRRSPDAFRSFFHMMSLRKTNFWEKLRQPSWPKPMGYEGGDGVCLRVRVWSKKKAEMETNQEVIVRCDLGTEEAKVVGDVRMDWRDTLQPFSYHNSLVAFPMPMATRDAALQMSIMRKDTVLRLSNFNYFLSNFLKML